MAYPLYSRLMEFRGESAQLLNGGELRFYELDTTTPKAVYADFGLTITNGSTVDLDASSRMNEAAFGSGSYYVKLFDAANVQQGEDTLYEPGGAALSIPIPNPGEYITGDGSQLLVDNLSTRLVPDATGHGADILGSDGDVPVWVAKPANGADGVSDLTAVGLDGKTTRSGTATGTNSGGRTQDVSVTFATAFGAEPDFIGIEITSVSLSTGGTMPSCSFPSKSATGFTVRFTMGEIDDTRAQFDFNAGVAFKYWAIGNAP